MPYQLYESLQTSAASPDYVAGTGQDASGIAALITIKRRTHAELDPSGECLAHSVPAVPRQPVQLLRPHHSGDHHRADPHGMAPERLPARHHRHRLHHRLRHCRPAARAPGRYRFAQQTDGLGPVRVERADGGQRHGRQFLDVPAGAHGHRHRRSQLRAGGQLADWRPVPGSPPCSGHGHFHAGPALGPVAGILYHWLRWSRRSTAGARRSLSPPCRG